MNVCLNTMSDSLEGSIVIDCRWPKINEYIISSGGMYPCNQHAPNVVQKIPCVWFEVNGGFGYIFTYNCASKNHPFSLNMLLPMRNLTNENLTLTLLLFATQKLMPMHSTQLNHASLWSGVSHQIYHKKPMPRVRWLSLVPLHPCIWLMNWLDLEFVDIPRIMTCRRFRKFIVWPLFYLLTPLTYLSVGPPHVTSMPPCYIDGWVG